MKIKDEIMPKVKAEIRLAKDDKTLWVEVDSTETLDIIGRVIVEDGQRWCRVFYEDKGEPYVIRPVRLGEWIEKEDGLQPICSKCGMSCSGIHRNADYSVVPTWKYCPNCGAKMKG